MLAVAAIIPAFECRVIKVHDGDGPLWCATGQKVRIAGVQAPDFESAEPCRQQRGGYVCDDRRAIVSRKTVERLVLNRTIRCEPFGRSWSRVVAQCRLPDGRSLSCAVIAAGAATRWDSYWRRYRMRPCS